jgi:thiol-disulfide isomerase/thioredoxin
MKKKILCLFFALLLIVPVLTLSAKEKEKVKVYIFEAGGCPYCEAEIEYLKKLDSYNKKFTIERRELYVDHVDWEQGKDYELGKAVAEKFQKDGFEDASYLGTPFVVISDVYAAATYSTDLETYINKAYKAGDKDVVNQIAKKLKVSNTNRVTENEDGTEVIATGEPSDASEETEEKAPSVIVIIVGVVVLVGAMAFVIKSGSKNDEVEEKEAIKDYDDEEIEEKKPIKKTTAKKTSKKTTKK